MKNCLFALVLAGLTTVAAGAERIETWPTWRGPQGLGIVPEVAVPEEFGPDKHVAWRLELPEPGNSTPVVWDDKIFLTQPTSAERKRSLLCLSTEDGSKLWQADVAYADKEPTHRTNPYCSASAAVDGERVIVWYGSAGVHCYDFEGNKLWSRDLGQVTHEWGYGSSPLIHGDLCFLNFGPGREQFAVALNKHTGEIAWKHDVPPLLPSDPEDEVNERPGGNRMGHGVLRGSWASPLVIQANGRDELIFGWPGQVVAFDPKSGKQLWHCRGLGQLVYASPLYGNGVLVVFGGYHSESIAVRPGGEGDVTETHRLWQAKRSPLWLGTGVIQGDHIFAVDTNGVAQCLELATGDQLWRARLRGSGTDSWSSITQIGDRLYMPNKAGDVFVWTASPESFQERGVNRVGDATNSSLVVTGNRLLLRTEGYLWCFGHE